MRRPPSITRAFDFPATTGTLALALAATLLWWFGKIDASPLMETPAVAHGEIWRLITSVLFHSDAVHLAFNLIGFWYFGTAVESAFGTPRTMALYVALAFGSGAAEFALYDGGIGLSGVGYGLFGLIWMLQRRDPRRRFEDVLGPRLTASMLAWFFLCLGLTLTGIYPVANIAHAAGAAMGALIGWAIVQPAIPMGHSRYPMNRRGYAMALTAAAGITLLVCATIARPLINLSPHRGETEAYLGYQGLLRQENRAAAAWFRDATLMRPANPVYWFNRGIAESRLQHAPAALAAYQHAATLAPQNTSYQLAMTEMKTYVEQTMPR